MLRDLARSIRDTARPAAAVLGGAAIIVPIFVASGWPAVVWLIIVAVAGSFLDPWVRAILLGRQWWR